MPQQQILLVEDDPDLAPLLEHVLVDDGYSVHVAKTLQEAEALLDEHAYSLVIADLRLPDGDGLALADLAAEIGVKTAIMSGYVHQLTGAAVERQELMVKPMRPAELIASVRRLLG